MDGQSARFRNMGSAGSLYEYVLQVQNGTVKHTAS